MVDEIRQVMLNGLARFGPVATPLRRLRERSKGYDLQHEVRSTLARFAVRRAWLGDDAIRDATVLEIGSGRTFGLALLLVAMGARRVVNVEIADYRFIEDVRFYRTLAEHAAATGIPMTWPPRGAIVDPSGHTIRPDPAMVHLHLGRSAARVDEPDGCVDLAFSVAVFEHIRPEALPHVLGELRRLLRPGGRGYHRIDLADHYHRQSEPFRFLRLDERSYERMYSHRFSYSNRYRLDDYDRLCRAARFDDVRFADIDPYPDLSQLDRWRAEFHPAFATRPVEVLRPLSAMLVTEH